MKATGIVRRIDDLGRVVIPKEIRKTLKIREGDSLEIYTDHEGEIILKKYSPIIEMGEIVKQYVDSLAQTSGGIVAVTDRDRFIAVSPGGKKELLEKPISKDMEEVITNRTCVMAEPARNYVPIADEEKKYACELICPIIVEGDVKGSIVLLSKSGERRFGEAEEKLMSFAAGFIGKQME